MVSTSRRCGWRRPTPRLPAAGACVRRGFVGWARRTPTVPVVDPQIAAQLLVQMLETVVQPKGHGIPAGVGAQLPRCGQDRHVQRRPWAAATGNSTFLLFAGLVPASAPRLAVVVTENDPQGLLRWPGCRTGIRRVVDDAMRPFRSVPGTTHAAGMPGPDTQRRGRAPGRLRGDYAEEAVPNDGSARGARRQ